MLLPHLNIFCNTKGSLQVVFLAQFSRDFWRRTFLKFILSNGYMSLPDWLCVLRCWMIYLFNPCFPSCDVIKFETNFTILINLFSKKHDQKSQDKNLSILKTKRTFQMKWKAFFKNFQRLSLRQIKKTFLWESDFNFSCKFILERLLFHFLNTVSG